MFHDFIITDMGDDTIDDHRLLQVELHHRSIFQYFELDVIVPVDCTVFYIEPDVQVVFENIPPIREGP